jgi:hypothetical protein
MALAGEHRDIEIPQQEKIADAQNKQGYAYGKPSLGPRSRPELPAIDHPLLTLAVAGITAGTPKSSTNPARLLEKRGDRRGGHFPSQRAMHWPSA